MMNSETTLYEQFIEEMERNGFRKNFVNIEEKDVMLSNDDEVIYVTANDCEAISIKGIRESKIRGKIQTRPHQISLKVYDYNYTEAKSEDTIQFSVTEFRRVGLPTIDPDASFHTIYYHYPYTSEKLKLKKGMVITKNKRLELRIMRKGKPIKIGKFGIKIECDKWYL